MALCRHFVKGSELFGEVFLKLPYMSSSAEDNVAISTGEEEGSQYLSQRYFPKFALQDVLVKTPP